MHARTYTQAQTRTHAGTKTQTHNKYSCIPLDVTTTFERPRHQKLLRKMHFCLSQHPKWSIIKGCGRIVFLLLGKVPKLVKLTREYLGGIYDKSWSNSLNAQERCFSVYFIFSFSIGYTGPSFTKGKEIMPSHNSLRQQQQTIYMTHVNNIRHCILT